MEHSFPCILDLQTSLYTDTHSQCWETRVLLFKGSPGEMMRPPQPIWPCCLLIARMRHRLLATIVALCLRNTGTFGFTSGTVVESFMNEDITVDTELLLTVAAAVPGADQHLVLDLLWLDGALGCVRLLLVRSLFPFHGGVFLDLIDSSLRRHKLFDFAFPLGETNLTRKAALRLVEICYWHLVEKLQWEQVVVGSCKMCGQDKHQVATWTHRW